ncbi:MAG: alpha-E domain-containing protein [Alphaproteobacteria bacterium]|nr:alpha-E domain-containing protein [Alphaproteobacteria bacterium]
MMLARVADSLYWMSRYIERAEHTSRMIAVKLESMVEQTPEDAAASWTRVVAALAGEPLDLDSGDAFQTVQALTFDRHNPSSLASSLRFARDNARQVREELSTEVWENLNRLYLRIQSVTIDDIWVHNPARFFRDILDTLYLLDGMIDTTLRHGEGWHFLELGRFIERAQLVSRLLDIHFGVAAPGYVVMPPQPKYLDWIVLLKFCTAFEPYCKVHTAAIAPERIAQFLLFDAGFPHSVRYAVDRMRDALARVAPGAPPARRALCERLSGRLKAAVDFGQIDDMTSDAIDAFLVDIVKQCEQIHDAVYAAYIGYDAEAVL